MLVFSMTLIFRILLYGIVVTIEDAIVSIDKVCGADGKGRGSVCGVITWEAWGWGQHSPETDRVSQFLTTGFLLKWVLKN